MRFRLWGRRQAKTNPEACEHNAHMQTYRVYLREQNDHLATEYLLRNHMQVEAAIRALKEAMLFALAMQRLNQSIRCSVAADLWPMLRRTRGNLIFRPADRDFQAPPPWHKTKGGNMRYRLPGSLLFSPWPPNFYRNLRNLCKEFEMHRDPTPCRGFEMYHAEFLYNGTRTVRHLVEQLQDYQRFANSETIEAFSLWSAQQRMFTELKIILDQGVLLIINDSVRYEIPIPCGFTGEMVTLAEVEAPPKRRWVERGNGFLYL